MNKMVVVGALSTLLALPAIGNEVYVTDTTTDTLLHDIEETWNSTYANSGGEADFTGTLDDVDQTCTIRGPQGTTTINFKLTGGTYAIDFGSLDFGPLDPIEQYSCAFSVTVNDAMVTGDGTVSVTTPGGSSSSSCNDTMLGLKSFIVSGTVTVNGSESTLSDLAFASDSTDFYYSLSCQGGSASPSQLDALSRKRGLSKKYRTALLKSLNSPSSSFRKAIQSVVTQTIDSGI